ncbi:MAG: hypothetical protein K2P80_06630 [Beijerinckiaceae bacterium]|nr:hypothetical protein [Beijerinckiaceae bacterium]
MLQTAIAMVSVALSVLSGLSYIRATLRGEAKPNRVTWLLWSIAPMIGAFAQLASGVGVSTAVIFASGIMPLCVFIASFSNRNAYWKLERFDYACGVFSLLAVLLWAVTANPVVAIVFSLISDMLAATPTIRKFISHPETEDRRSYVLAAAGNVLGLFSIRDYTFESTAFNVYLAVMTVSFLPLLFRAEIAKLRA